MEQNPRFLARAMERGLLGNAQARGTTVLHAAARRGELEVLAYFLGRGADLSLIDARGDTPLHVAALAEAVDAVEFLLGNGAQINAQNREGDTPLHVAARRGSKDICKMLLDCGAETGILNGEDRVARLAAFDERAKPGTLRLRLQIDEMLEAADAGHDYDWLVAL